MEPLTNVPCQAKGGRGTMSHSSLQTVSDHGIAPAFGPTHLLRSKKGPCLSYQIALKKWKVYPGFIVVSLFGLLWCIHTSYFCFVSWFVAFLCIDFCLFYHDRCWMGRPRRRGSTTVMLMLQTVSSPMAMSLPMPSTSPIMWFYRDLFGTYLDFTWFYWKLLCNTIQMENRGIYITLYNWKLLRKALYFQDFLK